MPPITPSDLVPDWSHLPLESRLREPMFRRFEPLITIAVQRAPQETEFTCPSEFSLTTFTARFRDALLSLRKFEWNKGTLGTTIPMDKLRALDGKFGLFPNPTTNSVWFRAKAHKAQYGKLSSAWREINAGKHSPPAPWVNPTEDEIYALCTLLHTRRLSGPFFVCIKLEDSLFTSLTSQFDISIVWDDSQQQTAIT